MNSVNYSQLARIYDKVMSHVNYKMWSEYVKSLFQFSDIHIDKILDVSCGTGRHISHLSKGKISVFGSDKSREMIKVAKRKPNLKKIPLCVNDASQLAFKSEHFDAVVMLYDSINYFLEDKKLDSLFLEIKRVLNPGGIFIFDIVTKEGLQNSFEDYYESNSWNGLAYQRRCWFRAVDKTQHNEFHFLFNGESYKEEHIQIIRDKNDWQKFIKKSGMKLMQEFSNFTFLPADEKSQRIHYVCKKER